MSAKSIAPFSVSQNFLTSSSTIRRLLRRADIGPGDRVIEIGAGKGHITRQLLSVAGAVTAYEIDPALCRALERTLGDAPGLTIRRGDFLQARLPARGAYKVFSNIPFCVTTAIVRKLTEAPNPPREAWLVMEDGAARRILGLGGESALSLAVKPVFEARIVHRFSREDFHPAPSVETVLVRFSRKDPPDLDRAERAQFAAFVRECREGGTRRLLTKRQIAAALRMAGLPVLGPSGQMRYVQWLCLFRYSRHPGGKR